MTLAIIAREHWEDAAMPVIGPKARLDRVTLLAAHYTAMATVSGNTPAVLRSIQRDYTNNRGYSIGYNFAIDQVGACWECRGFDIRCAANRDFNDKTIAVLCLVDGAEPMNEVMCATFRALGAEAQRHCGQRLDVIGHRDIGATSCPGNGIYRQVVTGKLEPDSGYTPKPKPPPQQEDEMATVILAVDGRNAQFIGQGPLLADGTVHNLFVTWFGPGRAEGNPFLDDHAAAPDTKLQPVSMDTLKRDLVFLGNPEEIEDSTGQWSETDFYRVIRS